MAKGKRRRISVYDHMILLRYNHIMEIVMNFMQDKEWLYSDYNLQELWNYIQEKRNELWWDHDEI